MRRFEELFEMAAAHKGGVAALEARLPAVVPDEELARLPDDRWLAAMTRRVFQAGFNWSVIEKKWPGFEAAFEGFQPGRWALMSDEDLDGLLRDNRIVRNAQKILSVRDNAAFLLDLAREHGSAGAYLARWPAEDYVGLLDLLKRRGSRLGGNAAQYLLRGLGKDSFLLTGDVATALIREGVVAKPPSGKRDLAAVQGAFNAWRAESGRPLTHISRVLAFTVESENPYHQRPDAVPL